MRRTRGTFRGRTADAALVVRFDLDGTDIGGQPVVSGDVYDNDFDLKNHVASFLGHQLEITDRRLTANLVFSVPALMGSLQCERLTGEDRIRAQLKLLASDAAVAETYDFVLESHRDHFRELELEVDLVRGTEGPGQHALDGLKVTVENSFQRAGIKILPGRVRTVVDPSEAGEDYRWSPSELNAAMHEHFSGFQPDRAAWRAYLLVATRYLNDRTTGIMFDTFGRHRQGVAVFHSTRKSASQPEHFQRDYVRTAVHELGHALNLLHSFDPGKRFGKKRRALSFMNYPDMYPGGAAAYWGNFKFRFEPEEILFMRHGPLPQVVPGGSCFSAGGHSLADGAEPFATPTTVDGLQLELRVRIPAKKAEPSRADPRFRLYHFAFGEPVHIEAKLSNRSGQEKAVEDTLDPSHGQTTFLIRQPSGSIVSHRPIMRRCGGPRTVVLHPERRPSIYEDIDLTYGTAGFHFAQPGGYRIQCVLRVGERSLISNALPIWVAYPSKEEEKGIAPLLDDRVGLYLTMWGSEWSYLDGAKGLLDTIEASQPFQNHPVVDWHRLCRASCSVHGFKTIERDGQIVPRRRPAEDLRPLRDAMGLNTHYSPRRRTNLSNIVMGHLWGQLMKIVEKDGDRAKVDRRLQRATKQLKGLGVKDWMLVNLRRHWRRRDV